MDEIKILINVFDDSRPDLEFIMKVLGNDNRYGIVGFDDAEAFKNSISDDVKIVITDMNAPNFDLISMIEYMKVNFPGIYVIVISGYLDVGMLRRFIHLRIWEAIDKNTSNWLKELKTSIDELIPKIQLKNELLRV